MAPSAPAHVGSRCYRVASGGCRGRKLIIAVLRIASKNTRALAKEGNFVEIEDRWCAKAVDWCEIRNEAHDRWREVLAAAAGTDSGPYFDALSISPAKVVLRRRAKEVS